MNLVIDVGNTIVKVAVFNKGVILYNETFKVKSFPDKIAVIFSKYPELQYGILSNVGMISADTVQIIKNKLKLHILSPDSNIPFKNNYTTPTTLGADRMALVTAAYYRYPKQNSLIIDAGTCITYDILDAQQNYWGGAISPGIQMRFKALHQFTSNLPLVSDIVLDDFIGNSTQKSIISGVINGIVQEIEGIIVQYSKRYKDLTVILTGGDAQFLSKQLKNTIFANSKFLLEGLNYILKLNKDR
ncbi:type III pantothenate kinase [Leptobacterium sp. I13]|uniref:type III pantothenate kinase n=1 Tax=Leptobacterium meishanense TaxID=3128904 RepID=UPI0030EED3E0